MVHLTQITHRIFDRSERHMSGTMLLSFLAFADWQSVLHLKLIIHAFSHQRTGYFNSFTD